MPKTKEERLLEFANNTADALMQAEIDLGTTTIDKKGNVSINADDPEVVSYIRGIVGLKRFVHEAKRTGELGPAEAQKIQDTVIALNKITEDRKMGIPIQPIREDDARQRLKSVTISPTEEQFARVMKQMRREDKSVPGEAGERRGNFFMQDRFGRAVKFETRGKETAAQTRQRMGVFPFGKAPQGIKREDVVLPDTRGPQNEFIFEAFEAAFPKESE